MTKRHNGKAEFPKTSELIVSAGDGRGNYWVNAGLMAWELNLEVPAVVRKLVADGETIRVTADGRFFVLMSEVRAEHYRRLAILRGR